jgi:SARP family transcriptional regulator, regulator of embCAB operon
MHRPIGASNREPPTLGESWKALLRIYLSGEVQVEHGEQLLRETGLLGRQGRLVFVYLVVERARAVDQAELAELLWPDAVPHSSALALSAIISKLRTSLGGVGLSRSEVIPSAFGCYQLRLPNGVWVDHEAAAAALDQAEGTIQAGEVAAAFGSALIAVTISKRPFLRGEDGDWVERKRSELAQTEVRARDCLAQAFHARGEIEQALRHAREVVRLEPFRESGYVRLMKMLAERGDPAEAIRVYEQCRALLAKDLGVRPSPEVEELRRQLVS